MNPTIPDDARDSVQAVADRLRQIARVIESVAADGEPTAPAAFLFANLLVEQLPRLRREANAVYKRLGKASDRWVREKVDGPGLPLS